MWQGARYLARAIVFLLSVKSDLKFCGGYSETNTFGTTALESLAYSLDP
jgi:hypothetical protein